MENLDTPTPSEKDMKDANETIDDQGEISFFKEANELKELLSTFSQGQIVSETTISRNISILEKYQEQPQLLDPHLQDLVSPLLLTARLYFSKLELLHPIFRVGYTFVK